MTLTITMPAKTSPVTVGSKVETVYAASASSVVASDAATDFELIEGVPVSFVEAYADVAGNHAVTSQIEPSVWFSEVKGLEGVWGEGASAREATDDLRESIIGWVSLKLRLGVRIPPIEGLDLNVVFGA